MIAAIKRQVSRPTAWATASTIVVFGAAFVVSFDALMSLARSAGIREMLTPAYPALVDGVMVTGTAAAVGLRRARLRTRAYCWLLIAAGVGVSVAGNSVHSQAHGGVLALPWWAAATASAVPALSLAASLHLLVVVLRHTRQVERTETHAEVRVEVPHEEPAPLARTRAVAAYDGQPDGRAGARRNARPAARKTRSSRVRIQAMLRHAQTRGQALDAQTVATRLKVSSGHARKLLADARQTLR